MPRYSEQSLERLRTCDPALQFLFGREIEVFDCSILCGHRGKREQDAAFLARKTKVQWPDSKHNPEPSLAIDAAPYWAERPHIRWPRPLEELIKSPSVEDVKVLLRWFFFASELLGLAHAYQIPLRWGHDWNQNMDFWDQKFVDAPHFELVRSDV